MARARSTDEVKEEIRRARAALHDDVVALDRKLHVDVRHAKEQGIRAAIGIATVGLALAGIALFGKRRERKPHASSKKRKTTRRS